MYETIRQHAQTVVEAADRLANTPSWAEPDGRDVAEQVARLAAAVGALAALLRDRDGGS